MTAKRRTPARKTAPQAKAPIFARPEVKASTSPRAAGPNVSARVEFTLIKIGTMFHRSRTVNRAARGKGAGGFFARMLRNGSKALTQGAAAGLGASRKGGGDKVANGLTSEHSLGPLVPRTPKPGGAESFARFQDQYPGRVHPGRTATDPFDDAGPEGSGPITCEQCGRTYGHTGTCPMGKML